MEKTAYFSSAPGYLIFCTPLKNGRYSFAFAPHLWELKRKFVRRLARAGCRILVQYLFGLHVRYLLDLLTG